MKRKLLRLLGAVALTAGSLIAVGATAGPASAARADCAAASPGSFYHAGMTTQTGSIQIDGVSASFIDAGDYLCSTVTDLSNVVASWTMVFDTYSGLQDFAQSGQVYYWGAPCNRFFAEYVNAYPYNAPITALGSCVTTGATHLAWSYYDSTNHVEKMLIDNAVQATTPYDPKTVWGLSQWQAQWMGEAHYTGSDIPGTPSLHTHFWNMQYENSTGGFPSIGSNPTGLGLGGYVTHPRATIAGVSSDAIDVWTYTP